MFAFLCAALASMTTILLGYSTSSSPSLEDLDLTGVQVELLTGSMNLFMLASILVAGSIADRLGRRCTLVLANAFLMAGALAMALGASFAMLMAARFVTSVGAGFSRVVAPVYNAEISPPSTRGVLSSLLDMFVNVGILLSYVSNYAFAGMPMHLGWRVMFAVGTVPPVFLAAGVLAMPESPRWLAMRGRYADAHAVLMRTSDTPAEADLRFREIKHAAAASPSAATGVWKEMLVSPSASIRRIFVCVLGLQFFQQASGIDAIILYTPLVLQKAGISSNTSTVLAATVGVGVVKTCSILVATLLSDRLGRRPLLLASAGGCAVALASVALTLCVAGGSRAAAVACFVSVLAFVAAFSIGLGPAGAGHEPRYGGEPGGVRGGGLDVHLSRRLDHNARVLLLVCRRGGHHVRVRVHAAAGDQWPKLRGHGRALLQVIIYIYTFPTFYLTLYKS
ncbi:hypothetical protein HU200_049004 [Digitaria exilis]|uniref:Major facilitator superfamily (MFS) profile domain-containing protein n=1 Tax=Digitaria exilis TaxID=1010633 RepID=A0A835AXA9_9POAL|nr:hypothetical protein HU200_049004 [Digitaria exilis]